jgi:hypothetical protein
MSTNANLIFFYLQGQTFLSKTTKFGIFFSLLFSVARIFGQKNSPNKCIKLRTAKYFIFVKEIWWKIIYLLWQKASKICPGDLLKKNCPNHCAIFISKKHPNTKNIWSHWRSSLPAFFLVLTRQEKWDLLVKTKLPFVNLYD